MPSSVGTKSRPPDPMPASTASREPRVAGSCAMSHPQPRAHTSSSTTPNASPTPTCPVRSHGSSSSTLGAITRNTASASASATRVHTTEETATPTGTPASRAIRCTRGASPATATERSLTAEPTRFASWAARQVCGATGLRIRCHAQPFAASEERLTTRATARSHGSAANRAATVTRQGKPARNLSASATPTSPTGHQSQRQRQRCAVTMRARRASGRRTPPRARRR